MKPLPTNRQAFRDMLALSEIGKVMLAASNDGYNVIVGSTFQNPILMESYADHPRQRVWIEGIKDYSTAAGRYQILEWIFDAYRKRLSLPDFGPVSQDKIAMQLIGECRALADIDAGRIELAITKCKSRWASLPGANYPGQHMNKMSMLVAAYRAAGGKVA
jgi:muramidase (phage lysozyme)